MAKELPGFYYDADKNRYFPCKGPLPGSRRRPPPEPAPPTNETGCSCEGMTIRQEELLYARELSGNVILSRKHKLGFQAECRKIRARKPVILKCKGTEKLGNIALEHFVADVATPHGLMERDILLGAGANGSLSLSQIGKAGPRINSEQFYKFDPVWPPHAHELQSSGVQLGRSHVEYSSSEISCMRPLWKNFLSPDGSTSGHFIIATLAPGSILVLDLSKPLDFDDVDPLAGATRANLGMFKQTIWTVDSDNEGRKIAVGANNKVVLIDMVSGSSSCMLKYKSDVLSLQFGPLPNVILSGMRNGDILCLDPCRRQIRTRTSLPAAKMPSSVCCLTSLKQWDQYFLASSMDGSIRLYDYRSMERGPVQCYEGHVNSHTRINLGIDPSEKLMVSGGEDFSVRIWDIKSGELLFDKKVMKSVASSVCWPEIGAGECYREDDLRCGVWLGSYEGIFYMDWF